MWRKIKRQILRRLTRRLHCYISRPGAATQVSDLIISIKGFNLESGTENSLVVKLQHALSQVKAGNKGAACNHLKAIINQVQAITGKKLSAAQAGQMVITVKRLVVVLGC